MGGLSGFHITCGGFQFVGISAPPEQTKSIPNKLAYFTVSAECKSRNIPGGGGLNFIYSKYMKIPQI